MVVNVTPHAMIRANERFCWTDAKIKQYWSDHVDYSVFNDGEGVYGVVLSGVYFVVAYDPARDRITIMSLCHARSWNETGWQKPLREETDRLTKYNESDLDNDESTLSGRNP